ncbi:MAG: medium chain dehydrogenase/reductase family protein [Rubricoccaceae bacterium]
MQHVWIPQTGGPEVLEVRDAPDPKPGPGEVQIAVEAAGINFADILARQGIYPDAPPLPAVVGYEVAGAVAAVGGGVTSVSVGDPVIGLTRFGGYSSQLVVPESGVFPRPDGMTPETGAAIPVTYLTAFQMMIVMGSVRHARELGGRRVRVLVHGASGGVGTACADLGKTYGAELFGTASAGKHDYVRERGYHHAIDYRQPDWPERVMSLTDGEGVDLVLDPIGGKHWAKSLSVLAPSGRMVVYGISSATGGGKLGLLKVMAGVPWTKFNPIRLMNENQGVMGVNLGHLWHAQDRVAGWARAILGLYERGDVRPHVDRVFSFDEAADAHRYIEERKNTGKVLLRP